ncbi:hypothetical protein CRH01_05760 [Chryseobacterium rhizosphaerae]|uniref:phage baseplate assembly protein V n=1 Tax=Chryseobacterium rhizosphaerae TaxID=395937 RepID=UPI0011922267|nr:hypothetical protein CRH01_05760 [Chryseobacterium rhizosphaerae]
MDWQGGQDTTEFIRVMSPDAGSSDKVGKNRGFMSIPEVGDQVIVNFVHNHPDRPFVMGGMYHGGIGAGGGTGNNIMSFSGRSGAELKYDNGAGSMNLKDQGGANMHFDGAGNATTNVNTNHITNAGNTTVINVGATKKQPAQSIIKADSKGNVTIDAKTSITFLVGGNQIKISKEGVITIASQGKVESTAENGEIIVKSLTSDVTIESAAAKASIKGATETNLGGGATTNTTGGTVNINEL